MEKLGLLRGLETIHWLSVIVLIAFLNVFTWAFFRLKLHPLAPIPGPPHWILSRIPFVWALRRGELVHKLASLHEEYGPVVRIASNEVSFTDERAWDAFYAPYRKTSYLPKSPFWYRPRINNGSYGIMASPPAEHGRFRRAFAAAFTEKSMREHEPMILQYTDILITQLKAEASKNAPIDIVDWFEYAAFDIVGDLAFSKSFHSLENNEFHYLVNALRRVMHAFTQAVVPRILGLENAIGDIMIAGSETVASTLAAICYQIVRNPEANRLLAAEVRQTFDREEEIGASAVAELPYLNAVLDEAMRLCPSLPMVLPRIVTEPGMEACGYWLPTGTLITFCQLAAYTSPANFASPKEFVPERWLPDSKIKPHNTNVYHPFSVGPRDCVGKAFGLTEVRLILAKLIWNFDLSLGENEWDWYTQKAFLVWEKNPLYLNLSVTSR